MSWTTTKKGDTKFRHRCRLPIFFKKLRFGKDAVITCECGNRFQLIVKSDGYAFWYQP